jgi:hypothetical protein
MIQNYTHNPRYIKHGYDEDLLYVLVCQIRVWKAAAPEWFDVPQNCTLITEVEEIEINESYKELVNGAVVRLPKGAVIYETIDNKGVDDDIKIGNKTNQDKESIMSEASRVGELLVVKDMINNGEQHTLLVDNIKNDHGLAPETSNKQRIATANDFQIGNRIEIRLAYIYNPTDDVDVVTDKWKQVKAGVIIEELARGLAFTGFITGCSVSSPLEIECENMASILKKRSCR